MKKRIALAAVAALAGGLLVASPASAVAYVAPFTLSAVTSTSGSGTPTTVGTQIAGASNYSTISDTDTAISFVSGDTEGYLVVTGGTFTATGLSSGTTLDAAKTTATLASGANSVNVATPVNGTIVVNYIVRHWVTGIATDTVVQTITITVGAAAAGEAYNHTEFSQWFDVTGYTSGLDLYSPKGDVNFSSANWAAYLELQQYNKADTTTGSPDLTDSLAKVVTASLSGVGLIQGWNGATDNYTDYATYIAFTGSSFNEIAVYSDGRSGVSTLTIAVDGVTVATRKITFYGSAVAFTASIDKAQIQAGTGSAVLTVTAKDAAGIAVPGAPYSISDETATVGSANNPGLIPGTETYTVTGASKFAAVLTVGNGVVDTKTVVANFVTAGVGSVALTSDKASYAPGEKITFTVTAQNSDGVAVGDDSYSIAVSGSAALYGAPTTTIALKNGVGTFTAYAPVLQGPVVVVATVGGVAGTLNTSVVDAAAVAQAAAITALQTSVAALTTTVASLVASMTAQIKVINATMLKIQKALAALRASLKK